MKDLYGFKFKLLKKAWKFWSQKPNLPKMVRNSSQLLSEDKLKDLNVSEKMDTLLDQHFHDKDEESGITFEDGMIEFITIFEDFEDVISLSKRHGLDSWTTKLYVYQNKYYLYIEFSEAEIDEEEIDNILSLLLEYSQESPITVHMLDEYGKIVIENDVFATVDKYFV